MTVEIEMEPDEQSALTPTAWWEIIGLTTVKEQKWWRGVYQFATKEEARRALRYVISTWDHEDHERYLDFRINPPTSSFPRIRTGARVNIDQALPSHLRPVPHASPVGVRATARGAR